MGKPTPRGNYTLNPSLIYCLNLSTFILNAADIQGYLTNQKINPIEAKAWLEILSDFEAVMMAEQFERL